MMEEKDMKCIADFLEDLAEFCKGVIKKEQSASDKENSQGDTLNADTAEDATTSTISEESNSIGVSSEKESDVMKDVLKKLDEIVAVLGNISKDVAALKEKSTIPYINPLPYSPYIGTETPKIGDDIPYVWCKQPKTVPTGDELVSPVCTPHVTALSDVNQSSSKGRHDNIKLWSSDSTHGCSVKDVCKTMRKK